MGSRKQVKFCPQNILIVAAYSFFKFQTICYPRLFLMFPNNTLVFKSAGRCLNKHKNKLHT